MMVFKCKVKNSDNKVIKTYSDLEFEKGLEKIGIFKKSDSWIICGEYLSIFEG